MIVTQCLDAHFDDSYINTAAQVKQKNYQQKSNFIKAEKKLEKKHYQIVIGLMIFTAAYYFIEPKTIGYDIRYSIYIFWLPTIIGILILGYYRRSFLITRFANNKGIVLWVFMTFFYLLQGLMFSYISFGQIAKISWDYCNYKIARRNSEETFVCPITKFWAGKRPCLYFKFNNQTEQFQVNYQTIKDYVGKEEQAYFIRIKVTKGLWNYYTVNKWNIELE